MTLKRILSLAAASVAVTLASAAEPTAEQLDAIAKAGLAAEKVVPLLDKPLYQFTEPEVGLYLKYLQTAVPDLRARVVHLARKNLGQPYDLYLLGEMPFETYDPQPIYCLTKSDCVVFCEHTYAMALTSDWAGFIRMLQRIRYRDGRLGVATRNHYTEADWNVSNRWLVNDITAEIAGDKAMRFEERIDRAKFLKGRYGLEVSVPVQEFHDVFLPIAEIARAESHLREGDFVNVVRGSINTGHPNAEIYGGHAWVGHTGMITRGPDGTLNMIHSVAPAVREQPLAEFIAESVKAAESPKAKQRLLGFKFLRLEDDPLSNLRKVDGPDAPRVILPPH